MAENKNEKGEHQKPQHGDSRVRNSMNEGSFEQEDRKEPHFPTHPPQENTSKEESGGLRKHSFTKHRRVSPEIQRQQIPDEEIDGTKQESSRIITSTRGAGGGPRTPQQQQNIEQAREATSRSKQIDAQRERIETALEQIEKQGTGKSTDREKKELLEAELERIERDRKPKQESADAWKKDIDTLSPQEQESLAWNLNNVGYKINAIKNKGFAKALTGAAETVGEKSKLHTFLQTWGEQFSKKQKEDEKHIQALAQKKGGATEQLKDKGVLAGNALKYGRLFTDAAGWTMAPLRGVMLSGMFTASVAEAAKETRLKNESVIEKTRIEDMDKAAEEAWAIYENALNKSGKEQTGENKISAEELEKEYAQRLPADLLERLANDPEPGIGSGISQRILRWHMQKSAQRMSEKLEQIDKNDALSAEQKEKQKESYMQGFFANRTAALKDFDRLLSQQGAVDTFGMYARYAEKGAKAVVYAMMADSIYRLGSSLAEALSNVSEKDSALQRMLESDSTYRYPDEVKEGATTQPPETHGGYYGADDSSPNKGSYESYPPRDAFIDEVPDVPSIETSGMYGPLGIDPDARPIPNMEITIESGGSLWSAIESKLEAQGVLADMNEAQRTHAVDAIKDEVAAMSSQELKDIGISSGDIDYLKEGDVINLSTVMERANFVENATEDARGLSSAEMENIVENNDTLRAYVSAHPNESLTSEKVAEILKEDLERVYEGGEQGKSGAPVEQFNASAAQNTSGGALSATDAEEAPEAITTQHETNSATLEARIESNLNSVLGIENALASDVWKQLQEIEVQTIRELKVPEGGFTGEAAPLGPMQEYLEQLIEKTRLAPEPNESVDTFLHRAVPKTM